MRDEHSGSGRKARVRKKPETIHPSAPTVDSGGVEGGTAAQGSTGMGAFSDGNFQGGVGGVRPATQPGYGQDDGISGGLGQGSGYAQSSGDGGYGQGATQAGGEGQSGSDQHNDERYGRENAAGELRSSAFGYGGHGAEETPAPTVAPDPEVQIVAPGVGKRRRAPTRDKAADADR